MCGVDGIATPVIAFTFIFLAVLSHPQFNWTSNALSDLGVVPGITACLFNFGLIVGGLLGLIFAYGLVKFLDKNVIGKAGAIVFGAASLALEGIGWAPENVHTFNFPWHIFFSVAFFTVVPIALLVITTYFLLVHEKQLAGFTLLIAIVAAAPWALYFFVQYVPGVAIPELISALAASAWAITIGWRMYKTGSAMCRATSQLKTT